MSKSANTTIVQTSPSTPVSLQDQEIEKQKKQQAQLQMTQHNSNPAATAATAPIAAAMVLQYKAVQQQAKQVPYAQEAVQVEQPKQVAYRQVSPGTVAGSVEGFAAAVVTVV